VRILAIDTCLAACQVAVMDGSRPLTVMSEPMQRGHQERLATMVREAMMGAAFAFADLDRIAVTVGPGSFTGLRVGLAFAKGLGAALHRPVIGVGCLEALAASCEAEVTLAGIDAKRGQVYVQAFEDFAPLTDPVQMAIEDLEARLGPLYPTHAVGPGARVLAEHIAGLSIDPRPAPDPVAVALLAAVREASAPRPLYLRVPDAKLPGGLAL
jgi:tRNA threonylcarbamoyladenosine biosynthesis protein TsaB